MGKTSFRTIEPKILYFGTPVALISSLDEDGITNLAPMSSLWALGWTMMLGLLDETKTAENFARHPECVGRRALLSCANLLEAALHDLKIDVGTSQQFAPARRSRCEDQFRCDLHCSASGYLDSRIASHPN